MIDNWGIRRKKRGKGENDKGWMILRDSKIGQKGDENE